MSEERLQEIKDSIELQYALAKAKGYDNALLFTNEEEELIEEIERLNNQLDFIKDQNKYIDKLEKMVKERNSIIKEVREYINNYNEVIKTSEYLGEYKTFMIIPKELLEILDKV